MGQVKYLYILFSLAVFMMLGVQEGFSVVIKDYDKLMQEAATLRHSGRLDEAEATYNAILSQNPDDTDALVGRGFSRMRDKRYYDEAIADFEKAIELAPKYVDAYLGQATAYRRRGNWPKAKEIMHQAAKACEGDEEKMRYLAATSWREGYYIFARRLDREYPPDPERELIKHPSEIAVYYMYDWVDNRPGWEESGMVLSHKLRPDLNVSLSQSTYRRNDDNDYVLGAGIAYRYNYYLTFQYQSYFAQEGEFLADQKHRPEFSIRLPSSTVLSSGVHLDKYSDDWAKVGLFGARQYFGSLYVDYKLQSGEDNFDKGVMTHIGQMGYENEGWYSLRFGYSTGNESIDPGGGSLFSNETVETFFGNIRYYFGPRWGIITAGGREYRNNDFYRDTASLSMFIRF